MCVPLASWTSCLDIVDVNLYLSANAVSIMQHVAPVSARIWAIAPLAVPLNVMTGPCVPKLPTFADISGGGGSGGGGGGTPCGLSSHTSTGHGMPFMSLRVPSLLGLVKRILPAGYTFSKCMPFSRGLHAVFSQAGTKMHALVVFSAVALHFS